MRALYDQRNGQVDESDVQPICCSYVHWLSPINHHRVSVRVYANLQLTVLTGCQHHAVRD